MADRLLLRLPAGRDSLSVGGEAYAADARGLVEVPSEHFAECQRHGCVRVSDDERESAASEDAAKPKARRKAGDKPAAAETEEPTA